MNRQKKTDELKDIGELIAKLRVVITSLKNDADEAYDKLDAATNAMDEALSAMCDSGQAEGVSGELLERLEVGEEAQSLALSSSPKTQRLAKKFNAARLAAKAKFWEARRLEIRIREARQAIVKYSETQEGLRLARFGARVERASTLSQMNFNPIAVVGDADDEEGEASDG